MGIFFSIFRKPTIEAQAEEYPTLHNAIPNYLHILRQLKVWEAQESIPILQIVAKAAYTVIMEYYNMAIATRHSFVAILCDPRYKLAALEYLFDAQGGRNSPGYIKAKAHFQHTYSQYNKRAVGLAELERQRIENEAINARRSQSPTPEVEGQEGWRINPLYGWDDYSTNLPIRTAIATINGEVERWFQEPVIPKNSTPEA